MRWMSVALSFLVVAGWGCAQKNCFATEYAHDDSALRGGGSGALGKSPQMGFSSAQFALNDDGKYENSPIFPAGYWTLEYSLFRTSRTHSSPDLGESQLFPELSKAFSPSAQSNERWICFEREDANGCNFPEEPLVEDNPVFIQGALREASHEATWEWVNESPDFPDEHPARKRRKLSENSADQSGDSSDEAVADGLHWHEVNAEAIILEEATARQNYRAFKAHLNSLDPKKRKCNRIPKELLESIRHRLIEGCKPGQVAKEFGFNPSTVRKMLAQLRSQGVKISGNKYRPGSPETIAEIKGRILNGEDNKRIARDLGVTESTVQRWRRELQPTETKEQKAIDWRASRVEAARIRERLSSGENPDTIASDYGCSRRQILKIEYGSKKRKRMPGDGH
ncbi:MAG: hypothetical protein ACK5O7_06610 [Holosporales bacterium]